MDITKKTIILVLKKSYGWEFYPVIGAYDFLVSGYVLINSVGRRTMIEKSEVYDYYPEDDLEDDRFYYLSEALIHKIGAGNE